jgi:hypothetical protein
MRSVVHLTEQLSIGIAALAWLLLAVAELIGLPPLPQDPATVALGLVPLLALSYALGLTTDRLADLALDGALTRGLRQRYFVDAASYFATYAQVADANPALLALLLRTRSMLRVCRGWALNTAALLLVFNVAAWSRPAADALPRETFITIHGAIALGVGMFLFAHRRLLRSELARLAHHQLDRPPDNLR